MNASKPKTNLKPVFNTKNRFAKKPKSATYKHSKSWADKRTFARRGSI